tara:strand:- start:36 stop:188 length:153 start_codon:yes stop_codon:yes gene_type:complete
MLHRRLLPHAPRERLATDLTRARAGVRVRARARDRARVRARVRARFSDWQ